MSNSPFAAFANATLRFQVASGTLQPDSKGNMRPGKAVVEVTAILDQGKLSLGRGSVVEERPGVDTTAVFLEGFVVEVVGATDPLALPSIVTPDSACQAIWAGRNGQFFLQLTGRSPFNVEAVTGDELKGYFQPSNFIISAEAWVPPAPSKPPTAHMYEMTFTQTNLSIAGLLAVEHGLNGYPSAIAIWDETGELIMPDEIDYQSANALAVNLESFAPISGTWRISVGE